MSETFAHVDWNCPQKDACRNGQHWKLLKVGGENTDVVARIDAMRLNWHGLKG